MKKPRIIFCGTPSLAVPVLKSLLNDERFEVAAVVTQPDMPAGRSLTLTAPPIKILAQSYGLPVFQPAKISHCLDELRALSPEVIVVLAYAQIIPKSILDLPPAGCVNLHASLLPKYRGASVLQAPIMNGDTETGITIMRMDETLDTGPIISQAHYILKQNETADSLGQALSELGARLLPDILSQYLEKKIQPQTQHNDQASYVGRLEKKDGIIDWLKTATEIERFVRAMTSWPSAWTWINGKQLKILEVDQSPIALNTYKPGKTFVYNSNVAVQCGTDCLSIRRLQLEGKKPMTSQEFMRGYKDFVGSVLG